jgi:hypothetical protein
MDPELLNIYSIEVVDVGKSEDKEESWATLMLWLVIGGYWQSTYHSGETGLQD